MGRVKILLIVVALVVLVLSLLPRDRPTPATGVQATATPAMEHGSAPAVVRREPATADAPAPVQSATVTKHRVDITVVDEAGAAISGAKVECDGSRGDDSSAPRQTDARGRFTFEALSAGKHRIDVAHPDYVNVDSAIGGRTFTIDGDMVVPFELHAMYGVAFALPSQLPIDDVDWNEPLDGIDWQPPAPFARRPCLAALQARLPGALVYCARPLNPERGDLPVTLSVITTDGSVWQGTQVLRPLREITEATPLELKAGVAMRRVQFELRSPSGTLLDVPLQIVSAGAVHVGCRGIRTVLPGQSVWLVHDRYLAEANFAAPWFHQSCEMSFAVSALDPADGTVRLRFAAECLPIEIVPTVQDGETYLVGITVDDPTESGIAIGWRPKQGPIRLLVPVGPLTIRTSPGHYRPLDLQLELRAEDRGRRIPLALVKQE